MKKCETRTGTFDCRGHEGVVEKVGPGQTLAGILVEQPLQEILEDWAHVLGPLDRVLDDHGHQLEDAVGVEGGRPHKQLVQDAAHCPAK